MSVQVWLIFVVTQPNLYGKRGCSAWSGSRIVVFLALPNGAATDDIDDGDFGVLMLAAR